MKKNLLLLLVISFFIGPLSGEAESEPPYKLDWLKDGIIAGSGAVLFGTGIAMNLLIEQKPASEVALDLNDVNSFDRWSAVQYNKSIDTASDILSIGLVALPAALFINKKFPEILTIGVMYGETLLISYSIKEIVKAGITRYRPYSYFENPHEDYRTIDSANSFISGHTTLAFTSAAFITSVFNGYNPHSPWNYAVGGGTFALASTVAAFRIASGNHFLSDVLAGAAAGTMVGILVPFLHKINEQENVEIAIYTEGDSRFCMSFSFSL